MRKRERVQGERDGGNKLLREIRRTIEKEGACMKERSGDDQRDRDLE